MATVTGLTATRMIAMENATIISGAVVGGNLILTTRGGTQINAGPVTGPMGPAGPTFVVCTSTTRPAYTGADQGKAIYETDTKFVRIWTGTRFRLQERIVCTSTTRPTGLVTGDEGTKIYETDTNLEYSWTGASWFPLTYHASFANAASRTSLWPSPADGSTSYLVDQPGLLWTYYAGAWHSPAAMGLLFYEANSNDVYLPAAAVTNAPISTFTFTPAVGRRIKVTGSAQTAVAAGTAAGTVGIEICNSSNTVLMQRNDWILNNDLFDSTRSLHAVYSVISTGIQLSFRLRLANAFASTTGLYLQDSMMMVEDIGGA